MRVVLDTNVVISALLFGGIPRKVLERGLREEIVLLFSEEMLNELRGVLERPKFSFDPGPVRAIVRQMVHCGEMVTPAVRIEEIREDPADNRILECAVAGDADCIVSGDTHLTDLERYSGIRILTASQFLEDSWE